MKTETKPALTLDKASAKSIIELANQCIPDGKFKGLTQLLEPHEQPKPAKRG